MSKRGDITFIVILLILAAVVLMLMSGFLYKVISGTSPQLSESQRRALMDACKTRGQQMGQARLTQIERYVADAWPDTCDICPYGDSNIDRDDDGVPAMCDEDDDFERGGREKTDCNEAKNLRWFKNLNQCLCREGYRWDTGSQTCVQR